MYPVWTPRLDFSKYMPYHVRDAKEGDDREGPQAMVEGRPARAGLPEAQGAAHLGREAEACRPQAEREARRCEAPSSGRVRRHARARSGDPSRGPGPGHPAARADPEGDLR